MQTREKLKNMISTLSSLLVHGFLLIALMIIFVQQFPFSFAFYIYYLSYPEMAIRLILGVLFMTTILGFTQYLATKYVWKRNISRKWISILGSGACLATILQPLGVIIYLFLIDIYVNYYSIRYILAYFLILGHILLFGCVGWILTRLFREGVIEKKKPPVRMKPRFEEGTRSVCYKCGASHRYMKKDISNDGTVRCFSCGKEFMLSNTDKLLEKLGDSTEPIQ